MWQLVFLPTVSAWYYVCHIIRNIWTICGTLKCNPKWSKTSSKRALSPPSPKKVTNARSANQKKVVLESVWKPGFEEEIEQLRILYKHLYRIIQNYKKILILSWKSLTKCMIWYIQEHFIMFVILFCLIMKTLCKTKVIIFMHIVK